MKITLVADVFGEHNNGTSVTAARLVENMKARGHQVTVVSPFESKEEGYITVEKRKFGKFVNWYISKNGVTLGKPEIPKIWKAIKDADVVHILLPFKMGKAARNLCLKNKIPFTTAFHCQAENITGHAKMQNVELATKMIYKRFWNKFYNKVHFVHCPSAFIASEIEKNGFKTEDRVISNGVIPIFKPAKTAKPKDLKDKIVISFVGRYSQEKRQDIVINAVKQSKYEKNIQLVFMGDGPQAHKLQTLGQGLTNYPIFGLHPVEEVAQILNYSDLYVHASDIEIEGIGCIEALACGVVPVLSNSKKAALSQFAISDKNLFEAGDPKSLARKIDYWLDHPDEKLQMSQKYAKFAEQFQIEKCMDKMEQMFKDAIEYYRPSNK